MRKYLRDILARQAAKLPEFESQTEAETGLSKWRDRILAILFRRAGGSDGPELDYTTESLLRLEDWYFRKTEGGDADLGPRLFTLFRGGCRQNCPGRGVDRRRVSFR